MRLRNEDDLAPRLSPAEARAFLEVHAEREAAGARSDAPSVEDLAETLRLSPEEARSILIEARSRVETARIAPVLIPWVAPSLAVLAALGLSVWLAWGTTRLEKVGPAMTTVPATSLSPTTPLDSFGVQIIADGKDVVALAKHGRPSQRLQDLTPSQGRELRLLLVEKILLTLADQARGDARLWTPERLTVGLGQTGGRWVSLVVPIQTSTFPLPQNPEGQERLRETLTPLLDAAWPQIVAAAPR